MRVAKGLYAASMAFATPAFAQGGDGWARAADRAAARAAAPTIVVAYMDSVRRPRGSRGICPADGQVMIFERGQLRNGGVRVSVGVPCATRPGGVPGISGPLRPTPMRSLNSGAFARLFFDRQGRLVDYEPLRLSPEPPPPGW
jgi:hypothetical protein